MPTGITDVGTTFEGTETGSLQSIETQILAILSLGDSAYSGTSYYDLKHLQNQAQEKIKAMEVEGKAVSTKLKASIAKLETQISEGRAANEAAIQDLYGGTKAVFDTDPESNTFGQQKSARQRDDASMNYYQRQDYLMGRGQGVDAEGNTFAVGPQSQAGGYAAAQAALAGDTAAGKGGYAGIDTSLGTLGQGVIGSAAMLDPSLLDTEGYVDEDLTGYNSRLRQGMGIYDNYGTMMNEDIDTAYNARQASINADMAKRGFGNTTLGGNLALQVERQKADEKRRVGEGIVNQKFNAYAGLTGDALSNWDQNIMARQGAVERGLGQGYQSGLAGRQYAEGQQAFEGQLSLDPLMGQERITRTIPNFGDLASYGAALGPGAARSFTKLSSNPLGTQTAQGGGLLG